MPTLGSCPRWMASLIDSGTTREVRCVGSRVPSLLRPSAAYICSHKQRVSETSGHEDRLQAETQVCQFSCHACAQK